jgi:hypothetical protein
MAEIEANRDYYGPVRFDDINFQSKRGLTATLPGLHSPG